MQTRKKIVRVMLEMCVVFSLVGYPLQQSEAIPPTSSIVSTPGNTLAQTSSSSAAGNDAELKHQTTTPSPFPAGAWALESVSAAVAAVGFVMIGVGTSFLTQRTNLVNKASDPATKTDNVALARDIRSLEDSGTGIYVAGLVAAGVGLVGMVVGAIWLLTHHPTPRTLPKNPAPEEYGKASLPLPVSTHRFVVIRE